MSEEQKAVKCHSCGEDLSMTAVEALKDKARFTFAIVPKSGSMLRAETIGGTLVQLAKLIRATGRDHGVKRTLLVEGIKASDDGRVEIDLIECSVPKGKP